MSFVDTLNNTQAYKYNRVSVLDTNKKQTTTRKRSMKSKISSVKMQRCTGSLAPIQESIEKEVEVEIHFPPKKYNKKSFGKELKIVLNKEPTTNEITKDAKNEKRAVRRNLEIELQTPSTSQISTPLNLIDTDNVDFIGFEQSGIEKSFSNNAPSKDSGTGTMVEDTHSRIVKTSGKVEKR